MILASQIGLIAAIALLAAVVVSLYRQIGVLHERSAPADGLLTESVSANRLPEMPLHRLGGGEVTLAEIDEGSVLALLFVAPGCPMCERVVGECMRREVQVTFVASDFSSTHADAWMSGDRWVVSLPLALALGVERTPTVVVLDQARTGVLEKRRVDSASEVTAAIDRTMRSGIAKGLRIGETKGDRHAMA
ncbi:MAG: hypothetical protein QF921_14235 [Pseudomonadales bacterium]|nr:hypothetical protein [Pseudomonadales bacterium]MDP6473184.1 hypothetical protein [Pseudomonadales bacterium]MDP6826057.1 hypothetical protein [Pseudomonadales bacterium]MDP6972640.1 hypothetical protein [Pseudomonadales bacterium]